MTDYERAFQGFDAAGGRQALERQLGELDKAAQAAVAAGGEPDPRIMALREGLQRLLAALDDLARTGDAGPAPPDRAP